MINNKDLIEMMRNGDLPNNCSVGGYQYIYIDSNSNTYCSECANKLIECHSTEIVDFFVNWEGDSYYCNNCNKELESEYGEI